MAKRSKIHFLTTAALLVGLATSCGVQQHSQTATEVDTAGAAFALPHALDLAMNAHSPLARSSANPTSASSALTQVASTFSGTGGPGGMFVFRVRPSPTGPTVFNTVVDTITDETGMLTATCVNGVIDVYDLIVEPGAVLQLRGPNPCLIRVLHDVDVQGTILLRGGSAPDVGIPPWTTNGSAGGSGNAGGGRGGRGSPSFTQSDAQGEAGFGPFAFPGGGGEGGESSVSTASGRPGGGGGGAFAVDVPRVVSAGTLNPSCPEQSILGLDAEDGSNGQLGIQGALHPGGIHPLGGKKGQRPFTNPNPMDALLAALDDDAGTPTEPLFHIDDFWGVMRVGPAVIRGELNRPWAGAGGGGGGDVVGSTSFPLVPYNPNVDKRGAGGGAGGGSLTVLCLGTIRLGASGRIDASGGAGTGGQNTSGLNRISGGSGGGSGGHVVLQAGGAIDFTACLPGLASTSYTTGAGIFARGGEGGAGANNLGGASTGSGELTPSLDMLPPNAYGAGASCAVPGNTVGTIVACGGDGGPGVIQLHVRDLSHIKVPFGPTRLSQVVQPNPVGSTPLNVDVPTSWNRLVPIF